MAIETQRRIVEGQKVAGGEAIMQALVDNRVNTIFGYPGGAIMPTYDALYSESARIRHILTRHEQGATHMAEGYAWITKEPGVVLATSGPGATNTITGLGNAFMDGNPMVVITGQVARPFIGTQAFQEGPTVDLAKHVTKWAYQIQDAAEIPDKVDQAFAIAMSGRPGPVLLDVPKDVQLEEAEYRRSSKPSKIEKPELTAGKIMQLEDAAKLLNEAQRPIILAGHGVQISEAQEDLYKLAKKAGIPVANTLLGLSTFPQDDELFAGMLGMHGNLAPNYGTNDADVIFAVGMRFDDRVTGNLNKYAKQAKIIHVDIDPMQLNRLVPAEVAINLDAKQALEVLAEKVDTNQHPEWIQKLRSWDDVEKREVIDEALSGNTPDLKMTEVVDTISRMTQGEATIVADVGQHQMVAARYYRPSGYDRFITSGGMGTMGFALPASIGAQIAAPDRLVVGVIGDGSFQMTMQELGVIMQEDLPVKTVILNNSKLGMVRQWQDRFHGGRQSFVAMDNPNFTMIADAYGIQTEFVGQRDHLGSAIDRMISSRGSYLLEVTVESEENVLPMIPPGKGVDEMITK